MARTAPRRPAPGRAVAPELPRPAARVRPRTYTHLRDGFLLSAAGIAGFGAAPMLGYPGLGPAALVAGVGGGMAVAASGHRAKERRDLEDRVLEALAADGMGSVLRVPALDRAVVKFSRWTRGWPGVPQRIRLRYSPTVQDQSPEWAAALAEVLQRRLLVPYKVVEHDRLHCVVWVGLDTKVVNEIEVPYAQTRAERALTKLIDPSVTLLGAELDDAEELLSITVRHEAAEKMAAAGARARVERTMSTMLPGRWRAKWDLEGDTVRFEQRPTLPTSIWLPTEMPDDVDDLLSNYEQVRIPLGVDEDGEEIFWEPARIPQVLMTGGTGTGKTSTGHAILGKITQFGWPVWVLDGKRVEFLHHRTWPNVQIVATTVAQQVAMIHRVWRLQEERYRLMEEEGVRVEDFEPLVVILDEFTEFVAELLSWYGTVKQKGDPTQPPTLREHSSLARKARTARIHIIQTMQRPDVSLFGSKDGGEARSNFGQRISVGRLDPQGAMMMWQNPSVGTTIPRGARQRAMTTNTDGLPVEVQCYRFPSMTAPEDSDEGRLRERLRPTRARHPRLLVLPPAQKDEGQELGFWDYAMTEWVRAEHRPDLDPVVQGARRRSADDAREASSTMAVLGLRPDGRTRAFGTPPAPRLLSSGLTEENYVDDYAVIVDLDDYTGYTAPLQMRPHDVSIGDLIQVDDAPGEWVVVEEDPEDDVLEPGLVALSWRSDADERGSLSMSSDSYISVRRPEEAS